MPLPLDLHLDAIEGLPAPEAEARLAQLSSHIVWASRMLFVDIPLSRVSRNGSWPGTQPGVMARAIHRIVGYHDSTGSDSMGYDKSFRRLEALHEVSCLAH